MCPGVRPCGSDPIAAVHHRQPATKAMHRQFQHCLCAATHCLLGSCIGERIMLRSVFSQIGARMDAAAATRPSLAVTQAILAKTRKGLVEQGEDAVRFHAEGFATLLAWIGTGLKRSTEDTAALESATWQELVWVRKRLKDDEASLKLLDGSPSST